MDFLLWPLPYGHVERYIRKAQGTWRAFQNDPDLRVVRDRSFWLPYGLVRRRFLKQLALRKSPSVQAHADVPHSGFDSDGGQALKRIAAMRNDRAVERPDARILVCLHFFYSDLWPVIRAYLENLSPYRWDLVVTWTEGVVAPSALEEIRAFKPEARFVACPNCGFDIGPFVEALRNTDLKAYDVVFKLQTKGCGRHFLFMYDQIFKGSDWLFNLFDGTLGGDVVHRAVADLMAGDCALTAADNLIVRDPKHKRAFVRQFCAEHGLDYDEDYRFVAGTCFVVRSEVLEPLRGLGLGIDDFAATERGVFSMAHALERWMCFAAAGRMRGFRVNRPEYPDELRDCRASSALRLLDDPRFELDNDAFYRCLETRPIFDYEVVEIRVGDIRRLWRDARLYRLADCAPYRYLNGDVAVYDDYCRENEEWSGFKMSKERFDDLIGKMSAYDERQMPVVLGRHNIIVDGQHRSCVLLKRFGASHRIRVLRIYDGSLD